ncbi:MAG TPA: ADP-ribosylation factor-like protein, partial [Thermoanaerobaculia bacterium]
ALAEGMTSAVVSPAEAAGRTLYFDWLEHVGGSFEGIPIRFQIVSVPGQPELAPRRRALLAEADAVVFVANSTPEHLPAAAAHLRELRELLATQPAPRPGVIVQANHRDLPDALPLAALREALGIEEIDGIALVESVATENQGIRKAFVLSVRMALDRARELMAQRALPSGPGETDDPTALLAWLRAVTEETVSTAASAASTAPSPEPDRSRAPCLPDGGVPTGRVWPPIEGRIVLCSAATPGAVAQRTPDGSWRFSRDGWHFRSAPEHEFEHLDDGKQELLAWAQRHTVALDRLSPQRCIVLADTGWGTWRLWQLVRAEESLRQRLRTALAGAAPTATASLLRSCAGHLLAARDLFRLTPPLPCRLEVIGEDGDRPLYVGLLPPASWGPPADEYPLADEDLVRREMQPLIEAAGAQPRLVKDAWREILAGP